MITRTIGVSGNHVDVAAWVSYVQSNYVSGGNLTDDQTGAVTVGGMTVSTAQVISGWAPGGSGYTTTLTYDPASSGAAWFGPNCRSNAYYYNVARGAFIASSYSSGGNSGAITWRVNKNRTIGLMIKTTGGYMAAVCHDTTAQDDILVDGNILWATSDTQGVLNWRSQVDGPNCIARNNLMISERGAGGSCAMISDGNSTFTNRAKIYDNVFYADQAVALRAGSGTYVEVIGNILIPRTGNCAISARDGQTNGSNNATNQSAFNNTGYGAGTITGLTSSQFSITLANEFVGVTTGAMATDFRLKSGGTALQATGTTISGISTDATGFTRSAGSEDIGPYQLTAGGGGGSPPTIPLIWPVPRGAPPRQHFMQQGTFQPLLPGVSPRPFAQYDWPVGKPTPRQHFMAQGTFQPLLAPFVPPPPINYNWPVPRGYQQPQPSPQGIPGALVHHLYECGALGDTALDEAVINGGCEGNDRKGFGIPFYQLDWPVPKGPRQPNHGQPQGRFTGLLPVPVVAPFYQDYWPVPPAARQPVHTQPQGMPTTAYLPVFAPFAQEDWPVPRGPRQPLPTDQRGAPVTLLFPSDAALPPIRLTDLPRPRGPLQPLHPQVWGSPIVRIPAAAPPPPRGMMPQQASRGLPVQQQRMGCPSALLTVTAPITFRVFGVIID